MRYRYPVGVYLFIGRRGCGKTHNMRALVSELLADGRQIVLVHDVRAQYPGHRWRTVEEFRAAEHLPEVNVFYACSGMEVAALAVELAEHGTRVVLIIDELDKVCDTHRFFDDPPRKKDQPPEKGNLYNVCHYGRHIGRPPGDNQDHWGVTLLGSCRRPTNIHTDFGELAERFYLFAANGRNTLDWISETCGERVAASVAVLPPKRLVVYDPADTSDIAAAREKRAATAPKKKALRGIPSKVRRRR